MAQGVHRITAEFEDALCKYTGAPYAVAVDNCSNALYMALKYDGVKNKTVSIPERTYMSVPCEIIRAGGIVNFHRVAGETITGEYQIINTNVWDSSLHFTCNMYRKGQFQCLSFTGPYKRLKLSKGGAILCDDEIAYMWFKRFRFSGRRECSYHEDEFDMLGINCYMMPETAARGLLLLSEFYDKEGKPIPQQPITMPYPNLSKYEVYSKREI